MRIIGIRHRIKKTAEGEARPTQVVILENGETRSLQLETETDELDFVLDRFPVNFRKVEEGDELSTFCTHHVQWRKLKKEENYEELPASLIRKDGKTYELATYVPAAYDGLKPGDNISMILGGSGDNLAFALARRGQEIDAKVFRIPPFVLKGKRVEKKEDGDAELLANLFSSEKSLFYEVGPRDLDLIWLRECLRNRVDAMKARMACGQRLRTHLIGTIFCSPEGKFPEGDLEKASDEAKANDKIFAALSSEEAKRERDLEKACDALNVYRVIFEPIEGCGPKIASRIIGAVIDIRRFETKAKLRAFCGVHVLEDGRFPRRRNNEVANWNGDCRQALFLLGDQFNRRPNSEWGQRLLAAKAKYRLAHPEPIVSDDKLTFLYRRLEVFFRRHGVTIQPDEFKIVSIDGLYAWFRACVTEMEEETRDNLSREIIEWEEKIEKAQVSERTVKIFTAGHLHKMAIWYTIGKFVENLFNTWWKLEAETETTK
ncbi:MAG: transposase [bacterium]